MNKTGCQRNTEPQSRNDFSPNPYLREIIVDSFAGGGGASTGIELAIGRAVDIAINHDPVAIAMHAANHPDTEHYCESVWDVDPRKAANGRPVALCWFSPDCKDFSKAKGGKPISKHIRGLAWVAIRWAATVKPRVIMLENVEEFQEWGPLLPDNRRDPKQKGRTFRVFVNALRRQGYQVSWRELKACDYGAPTIRKRFFMVARCDERPIVWPEPTHGNPESDAVKSGKLLPWRTAAEIIDWSLPCPSIFERKWPLAENTMRRIARGIERFVINNPKPFIVKVNHNDKQFRGQPIDQPMQTITAKNGWGIVSPTLIVNTTGHPGNKVDEPLRTVTTGGHHTLITPTLIQTGYGEREGQAPRVPGLDKPLGTVVAGGVKHALVAAVIGRQFGRSVGHSPNDPMGTITAGGGGKSQLVAAFLAKHYGGGYTGPGADLNDPTPTVTTIDHSALVGAFLTKYHGPKTPSEMRGQMPDEPIKTVDTSNRFSLVTSHLIKLRGTCRDGRPVTEPAPTVTAGGLHIGEIRAFLLKYYGTNIGHRCDEPLQTVTTKHRFGLVTVEGIDYQIVDIGMRMLEPHELFAAQGFPPDYIIDRGANGNKMSKADQVAKCGNAVPPALSEALVRVNLPELCATESEWTAPEVPAWKIEQLAFFEKGACGL